MEHYYSIPEIAQNLGFSREKTRLMFKDEPGVMKIPGAQRATYRVPQSVVDRYLRRTTIPSQPVARSAVTA